MSTSIKNKRNIRCSICRKKSVVGFDCECGKYLCLYHRHPESHNCINIDKIKESEKEKFKNKIMSETIHEVKVQKI